MIHSVVTRDTATQHPALPELSRGEWQAIAIALRDAENAGCAVRRTPLGRWARLLHFFTGIEPNRPLANPRLEALRTYVCSLRSGRREVPDRARALIDLGYSPAQIDAINLLAY